MSVRSSVCSVTVRFLKTLKTCILDHNRDMINLTFTTVLRPNPSDQNMSQLLLTCTVQVYCNKRYFYLEAQSYIIDGHPELFLWLWFLGEQMHICIYKWHPHSIVHLCGNPHTMYRDEFHGQKNRIFQSKIAGKKDGLGNLVGFSAQNVNFSQQDFPPVTAGARHAVTAVSKQRIGARHDLN